MQQLIFAFLLRLFGVGNCRLTVIVLHVKDTFFSPFVTICCEKVAFSIFKKTYLHANLYNYFG